MKQPPNQVAPHRFRDFSPGKAKNHITRNAPPRLSVESVEQPWQAHRMEQQDRLSADERRLELREKVATAFRTVGGVAKEAGLPRNKFPKFHNARYLDLYGMNSSDLKKKKGLKADDNPFDYEGPLELSANEFQMNMAADVIKKEGVKGEHDVITKNRKIAEDVRVVMKQSGATMPENLPLAEPIKEVRKRVTGHRKRLAKN